MKFSDEYPVINNCDCFDPILISDTELFVDPFAVFNEKEGFFQKSYEKLLQFFNEAFKIAAKANRDSSSLSYRKLQNILVFPEINELGLGYSSTNNGAGASGFFCSNIIDAIYESIDAGLKEYKHFEEIGLFEDGFGCDRISDITCNILIEDIINYTKDICEANNIPVYEYKLKHLKFDFQNFRWVGGSVFLPRNKYKNRGILFVPQRFLRELPTINPYDFRDYIWDNKNEILRNDLNYKIKNDLDKDEIIKLAKSKQEWVREYEGHKETEGYVPYDFSDDPKGKLLSGDKNMQEYVRSHYENFKNDKLLSNCIKAMCQEFKTFVEDNNGYALLWSDNGKPKAEKAVQNLFYGFTKLACNLLNIDISKECDVGSGAVDFKYSQGSVYRILLEVKLISNTKYWNGLCKQLPKYMTAEGIELGIFMLVYYKDEEMKKITEFKERIKDLKLKYSVGIIIVDARHNKISASKL